MIKINTIFSDLVRYEKQDLSGKYRFKIKSFRVSHKSPHKHMVMFNTLNLLNDLLRPPDLFSVSRKIQMPNLSKLRDPLRITVVLKLSKAIT